MIITFLLAYLYFTFLFTAVRYVYYQDSFVKGIMIGLLWPYTLCTELFNFSKRVKK